MARPFDAQRFARLPALDGNSTLQLASELLFTASHVRFLPEAVAEARGRLAIAHAAHVAATYEIVEAMTGAASPAPGTRSPIVEEELDESPRNELLDEEFAVAGTPPIAAAARSRAEAELDRRIDREIAADDSLLDEEFAPVCLAIDDEPDAAAPAVTASRRAIAIIGSEINARRQARKRRITRIALVASLSGYLRAVASLVDESRPGTRLLAEKLLEPVADRNDAAPARVVAAIAEAGRAASPAIAQDTDEELIAAEPRRGIAA